MLDKKYTINLLPHGRQINVRAERSMMEALMDQSIFLRSDCGGKGICGKCRVKIVSANGEIEFKEACQVFVSEDIFVEIPESSMLSSHIITKAAASLPIAFKDRFKDVEGGDRYGVATDLGTTTIAVYLCNTANGRVVSSLAVKNPQALYGDDVMSRIGAVGQDVKKLERLQRLVVKAIEWGIKELISSCGLKEEMASQMVTVGNPTMIHIFAGVDPASIGVSPYQPAFYESRNIQSDDLGFTLKNFSIQILPQVSGFIGGDILSAAIVVDLENQPEGTLLVDLGTNGELMLKGESGFFATSCATGSAFEGATLSCGMQAIPGAINRVKIEGLQNLPEFSLINSSTSSRTKPSGVCGTGVISAVAQFLKKNIIAPGGLFNKTDNIPSLQRDNPGKVHYILASKEDSSDGKAVFISQKDIRSVQLGKSALITGIEFLLKEAGFDRPEKIIIAGAFGTFLDKGDMMTLGMIPTMDPARVEVAGNSAGAGAIMVLCANAYLEKAIELADKIKIVDLACNRDFQEVFVNKLNFPV